MRHESPDNVGVSMVRPGRSRRWAFRILAVLLPVVALAATEVVLRVAVPGRPTSFFIRDGDRYVTNPRFGWRFFPVALARTPQPLAFAAEKPANTFRVFVFGESAAMGIPEPAFGFSRMLEILLEATRPGVDVEMLNTAMTAINSHVIREIARECAGYDPDLFVIYMGNNEVVGPFGPGTVFTRAAVPLPIVRARLALQRTRIGQLAGRAMGEFKTPYGQWRGMEMLMDQQIPADDPRLQRTYASFRSNLDSILDAAASAGIPVMLSTVATNLRDNPPFASLHTRDASDADMQYQLAQAALVEGRRGDAAAAFARARDQDLLRFRADSRINELVRQAAAARSGKGVTLVDAERIFAEAGGGAPGDDLFWEHAHMTEAGNDLLARAFARAIASTAATQDLPSRAQVAERLALTDWDRQRMAAAILRLIIRPPFTRLAGNDARVDRRRGEVAAARALARANLDAAEASYRAAVAARPGDVTLRVDLARLLRERGKLPETTAEWRAVVGAMPGVADYRAQLAFALADEALAMTTPDARKLTEAEQILRSVLAEAPELPAAHVNLGNVLERAGRPEEAEAEYREALRLNPGHDVARLNLAALRTSRGDRDEAERLYREAIRSDPQAAEAHGRLAAILDKRQQTDEAIAEYERALALDPELAWARNNLAFALERKGDAEGAVRQYRAALEVDPEYTLARLNLGELLLRRQQTAEAAAEFEKVLQIARARGDVRLAHAMEQQLQQLSGR
jgi:tetratricopeptide (TPR) repeat protein